MVRGQRFLNRVKNISLPKVSVLASSKHPDDCHDCNMDKENCPNCNSDNIKTEIATESLSPYGLNNTYSFPCFVCNNCQFGWADYRKEDAFEEAMKEHGSGKIKQDS